MAENNSPEPKPSGKPTAKKKQQLPEERFWKRYSPHHEFPLSAASSFALHFLGGGGLIFFAVLLGAWSHRRNAPPPVEGVFVQPGGGGGDPHGLGEGKNEGELPQRQEAAVTQPNEPPKEQPKPPEVKPLEKPINNDAPPVPIDDKPPEINVGQLKDVGAAAERIQKLIKGKGQGGPGSGGGAGTGVGTGVGDKTGPGGPVGTIAERQARNRRWTMVFNTSDGGDYLKQLRHLGATLAIPVGGDQYMIIRDLSNPSAGKVEPLENFQEMYWVDTKPESVRKLAKAMGLREMPSHIAAFFPTRLEQELLRKELEYSQRMGRPGGEENIGETHFSLGMRPGGGYEPKVTLQTPRR